MHAMKAGMMLRRRWLLVFAGIALVALALLFLAPRQGWDISSYDLLRVRSGSMQPTLRTGETILADMSHYRRHQPRRGELAIYLTPGSTNELSIKRILALAGDRVLVRRGRAVVTAVRSTSPMPSSATRAGPKTTPEPSSSRGEASLCWATTARTARTAGSAAMGSSLSTASSAARCASCGRRISLAWGARSERPDRHRA